MRKLNHENVKGKGGMKVKHKNIEVDVLESSQ
jgi:hypothetical protein